MPDYSTDRPSARQFLSNGIAIALFAIAFRCSAQQPITARTPTTPLVVHDPYF